MVAARPGLLRSTVVGGPVNIQQILLALCRNVLVVMQQHRVGIVEEGVHSLPE